MIDFCHISPTKHLDDFCKRQRSHLLLAHLVEADDQYTKWYRELKDQDEVRRTSYPGSAYMGLQSPTFILDNGGFEMYKQNRPMYPSDKLIEMGKKVSADFIVMSDYPDAPAKQTIETAERLAPKFRQQGFGTFFVPQSEIGDYEDYISGFAWAASSPLVDYIGVSILGVPNAYGVEKDNKLQRFISRWRMMSELRRRGILQMAKRNAKKIHFLGMVDGPNEIELCKDFHIDTWDSSAAVWAGLRGIAFDNSPTGLINGKYEEEVDFDFHTEDQNNIARALSNRRYINQMCIKKCEGY